MSVASKAQQRYCNRRRCWTLSFGRRFSVAKARQGGALRQKLQPKPSVTSSIKENSR